jgi:hypothetical protein
MRRTFRLLLIIGAILAGLFLMGFPGQSAGNPAAKEKTPPVGPDDPTYRLFQVLDTSHGGKLADFYLLADTYKDAKTDQEFQHVLRVEYDKSKGFGKLKVYVRSVAKLTPDQLKSYTTQQIYEFGETDSEKFTKTEPGSFGRMGDLYFHAEGNMPLATAPVTDEVRKSYDSFLTQYLLPALEKK